FAVDPLTIDPDAADAATADTLAATGERAPHWWGDIACYAVAVGLVRVIQLMAFNGVGIYSSIRILVAVALFALLACVVFRLLLGDRARSGIATFLLMVAILAGD